MWLEPYITSQTNGSPIVIANQLITIITTAIMKNVVNNHMNYETIKLNHLTKSAEFYSPGKILVSNHIKTSVPNLFTTKLPT